MHTPQRKHVQPLSRTSQHGGSTMEEALAPFPGKPAQLVLP